MLSGHSGVPWAGAQSAATQRDVHRQGVDELPDSNTEMGVSMMLPIQDAKLLGLRQRLMLSGHSRTADGSSEVHKAQLNKIMQLAGHPAGKPEAYFRKGQCKRLVGKSLLKPFALTFDQKNRRIRLPVPQAKPSEPQSSGSEPLFNGLDVGSGRPAFRMTIPIVHGVELDLGLSKALGRQKVPIN